MDVLVPAVVLPRSGVYPLWTYATLRDALASMGRGTSLIIRQDDPLQRELGSLLLTTFGSFTSISGDATVVEYLDYMPTNSFFLVTLLDYLSTR